ncbi:MAG TPA: universal stress protein [Frankiaceae bacterium]|nr:universal stress protein [Frankiaceae bacterium]
MVDSGYRKVLVGTDGSESSYGAVDRAAAVAAGAGAQLVLVCAYFPMDRREESRAAIELGHDAYKVHGSTPADSVLQDAEDRARRFGATDILKRPIEGDAADALLKAALEEQVDLLVVGNRGLNRFGGRLLGSVPANIAHQAKCDFLIVHTTSGR